MIRVYEVTVTTTGANGSATGNNNTETLVNGNLLAISIDYGNQPATTDLTFTSVSPAYTFLVHSSSNTDAFIAPRLTCVDPAGAAITDSHGLIPLAGKLNVAAAQGDDNGTIVIKFFVQTDWRG
jgi:hypothetical protein